MATARPRIYKQLFIQKRRSRCVVDAGGGPTLGIAWPADAGSWTGEHYTRLGGEERGESTRSRDAPLFMCVYLHFFDLLT